MMKKFLLLSLFLFSINLTVWADADWSILNEPFDNLDDWEQYEFCFGEAEIATFDGQSVLEEETNNGCEGIRRGINNPSNDFTVEVKTYFDALGNYENDYNYYSIYISNGVIGTYITFGSDGLFISRDEGHNEAGTDLVQQDTWQTWRFLFTAGNYNTATVDVYLDGELKAQDISCGSEDPYAGLLIITNSMNTYQLTYTDYIKIDDGLHTPTENGGETTGKGHFFQLF